MNTPDVTPTDIIVIHGPEQATVKDPPDLADAGLPPVVGAGAWQVFRADERRARNRRRPRLDVQPPRRHRRLETAVLRRVEPVRKRRRRLAEPRGLQHLG
ncbi:MAG: hypothetical protein QM754_05910 [Tepidisphaeraceae bacterium]